MATVTVAAEEEVNDGTATATTVATRLLHGIDGVARPFINGIIPLISLYRYHIIIVIILVIVIANMHRRWAFYRSKYAARLQYLSILSYTTLISTI
jgi:hypothetical protein